MSAVTVDPFDAFDARCPWIGVGIQGSVVGSKRGGLGRAKAAPTQAERMSFGGTRAAISYLPTAMYGPLSTS